ncbi:hypothetical protein FQZ97_961300 [compost metagenome]
MIAADDGTAGLDAAGRVDFLLGAHVAAGLDALAAFDRALRLNVLPGMEVAGHGQVLAGADVPFGAHVADAVQAGGGLDAPFCGYVAARAQVAAAGDVGAGGNVLARHDGFARADAAAGHDAAARAHDGVHVDAHAHFQGAGEDDGGGVDGVQLEHGVGRAELVQQPAGVADPSVSDQGVKDGLVIPLSVVVADEPFVAARAGVLGFDEFLGELHGAWKRSVRGLAAGPPGHAENVTNEARRGARPRGRASVGGRQG